VFIAWADWSKRTRPEQKQEALVARLNREFAANKDARIFVIIPPAIQGLGVAGGFQMQLEDREGVGLDELQARAFAIAAAAQKRSNEVLLQPITFRAAVPQLYLDIDRVKAEKMGVQAGDVFATLQANLGSYYVNDFNRFNRTYQVRLQADPAFRRTADDIRKLQVRNRRTGDMVPLGTLLTVEERPGPPAVIRYNLYPTAAVQGRNAPGVSSGEALHVMEEIAGQTLPSSMGFDWTGIAFQEKRVSGEKFTVMGFTGQLSEKLIIMLFAVLLVYLVLAAQYESWILPFAVILVVPLGLLGVVAGIWLRGFDSNVYTQIGIILIIALASKNAILIVEFARELRLAGRTIPQAAVEAARLRFRPILMTSFAFILGVVPLVIATGAGAASRRSLGTAVFGGMITATLLAVFFVPVFFVALQHLAELRYGPPKGHGPPPVAEGYHSVNGTPANDRAKAEPRTAVVGEHQ
jgi:HAE1 family hydrophobic/amphiphilic exporter-1